MSSLPSPNLLDRLIGYLSPAAGARRMQARLGMAAAQSMATGVVHSVRRLSASQDGTLYNWNPRREQRLSEASALDSTMQRAESLAANDGHAASCVNALALNVVGSGLRPQSYPDAATLGISEEEALTFSEAAESAWSIWCAEAHAGATQHFDDLQYEAARSFFITGEILHLPVWLDETEASGRTFGLALHPLHPTRLRTPSDLQHRADIRCGVHLGPYNRPLGYYIANPTDNGLLSGLASKDFLYVPRRAGHRIACFHLFHSGMPEQSRGLSVLSPAMKQFRDLADYVDYELVGALIAASFTVFIETPQDVLAGGGFGGGERKAAGYPAQVQPGTMTTGQPGHRPHIISSNRPGPGFDAFYERVFRAASASTGQPYESVAKDFSKTNYSSARAALLEVWKLHTLYQEWLVRAYLNRLYAMVLEEAWLRDMLPVPGGAPSLYDSPRVARAWLGAVWTRPPRGQIDPVKEREAEQLGLDAITETRTAICHSRGLDFETLARTRQREEHLLKKLGLSPSPSASVSGGPYPSDDAPQTEAEGEGDNDA